MTDEHPDPERHWKNRRWMAWLSIVCILVLGGLAATGVTPEHSLPLLQSIVWALTAIVGVYSGGASAVDAMAKMRR